jgi:hypothetical protein
LQGRWLAAGGLIRLAAAIEGEAAIVTARLNAGRSLRKSLLVVTALCLPPALSFAALTSSQRQVELTKVLSETMSSATPDVADDDRHGIIAKYLESKLHRAMAVQDAYRRYFVSEGHEDGPAAAERTLEGCELRFAMACAVVATDDNPSSDMLIFKTMPRLTYTGDFDLAKVPTISAKVRSRKDVQEYFAVTESKAMAIHPLGFVFTSVGERSLREAQFDALKRCNSDTIRGGAEGPCFVYAIANTVVLLERLKEPR